MRQRHDREPIAGRRAPRHKAVRSPPEAGPLAPLLALQRSAGNAAVGSLLSGREPLVVQRHLGAMFLDPTPAEGQALPATDRRGTLMPEQFEVRAMIIPMPGEETGCRNGQYRQAVRGEYRRNGVAQKHSLDNGQMTMGEYVEDKINGRRYGYRGSSFGAPSAWFSDQACTKADTKNGCYFRSY